MAGQYVVIVIVFTCCLTITLKLQVYLEVYQRSLSIYKSIILLLHECLINRACLTHYCDCGRISGSSSASSSCCNQSSYAEICEKQIQTRDQPMCRAEIYCYRKGSALVLR